ncbi:MAG: hypothetical protein IH803_07125 [Nitrospirae bacterium]|nr:hypothetical protein [Nitrospirota bacterium]
MWQAEQNFIAGAVLMCRGIDRTPPLQRSHALSGRLARTCVANRGAEGTVTCRADAVGYPLLFRCNG